MTDKDRRKFGTDLTNVVQNQKTKKRLTKKSEIVDDLKGLKSSKHTSKVNIAKASPAKSKKLAGTDRNRHHKTTRLAKTSLNEVNLITDRNLNEDFHISPKEHNELPYQKIRTYSNKPGKEWAYVENTNKHVSFANEPLDIESWLSKEKDSKRHNKTL